MIVEATSSNAFLLYGSELYTPPLTDGCVEGVMRAFLLKELLPKMGVSCREISFNKEILEKADEMFSTNAVQGIQWVVGYKNRRFFNKRSKLLSVALNEACLIK
jgi:branched-chain amino acid aminotransferase